MFRPILFAALAGIAFGSLWPPARADLEGPLTVRIDSLSLSQFPQVQSTVTVLDPTGNPVVGLPPEAFQASAEGEALPVRGVASATDQGLGIGIVLAIDLSGSMGGQPLAEAKQAAKALIDQLGPSDQVAILAFDDTVRVVQQFAQDRQILTGAIDNLATGGNTALYEAVARSVELAAQNGSPRRVVVLLSDGRDEGTQSGFDQSASLAAAKKAGVPVFAIGLGGRIEQAYLEELVRTAPGQLMLAPEPEGLTGLYQTIGAILRHQYVLTFDASSLPLGGTLSLLVTVSAAGALGVGETALQMPPPPPQPTAVEPAPVAPAPERPTAKEETGSSPLIFLLPAGAGLALAVLVGLWWRRRRRRPPPPEPDLERLGLPQEAPSAPQFSLAAEPDVRSEAPAAWLQLITSSSDQQYSLGEEPVTIGYSSDCAIRLPNGAAGRTERVRVWRREGHYILHNLSRNGSVSVAGRPAVWAVLEHGDEIQLGPCRLVFMLRAAHTGER
ncbi:MAG TPA: VWA domain-containing protein [Dehalococcoidia bacterium]|nr:VWA domain-containing protein [Dehalococcoidia bacterium]